MPEFDNLVKAQTKELLIDRFFVCSCSFAECFIHREWRTRQLLKMAAQEEGLAAKVKEEKEAERKAKEQVCDAGIRSVTHLHGRAERSGVGGQSRKACGKLA